MQSLHQPPPLLSICIPTFNRARYLDCLLQELCENISELRIPYELIIGDNNSQDETPDVVAKYVDLLNLVYLRHSQNLGSYENLNILYRKAQGKYTIYLADDDLLIFDELHNLIRTMEADPSIGVIFAPWVIYDRVANKDLMQFYTLEKDTLINRGDHLHLFSLLIERHLFPEICIIRTNIRKSINLPLNQFAFFFFVQVALMVDNTSVLFTQRPFYRSVNRYFEGEPRSQAGHEEVKIGWDKYRGGLEYILSRFSTGLTAQALEKYRSKIDNFSAIRLSAGLRLRTADNRNWVENYYLAARLRSAGYEELLPVPYDVYRVNAALEYLLKLNPYLPETAQFAYLANDPPLALIYARGFADAAFNVIQNNEIAHSKNIVLLLANEDLTSSESVLVIKEADLMALFP